MVDRPPSPRKETVMAVARIATFPNGTKEQYEYLGALMGKGVAEQAQRRVLAAGPTDDGWTIIQIWESRDALDEFVNEHLRPAMQRAGDRGYPEPPVIVDIDLLDLYM
jgi:hypothetical protein